MAEAGNEVSRGEAQKLIEGGAQMIDVRTDHEWDVGRIAGATHLPLDELAQRAGEIDKERPVVLYCRGGNRSTMAAAALADGWVEAGLPVDPEDGYVAESGEAAAILQAQKKALSAE